MGKPARCLYEFGPFRLDAKERLLLRDGEIVPLQPKVFDTLLALVRQSGHLVEKDELIRQVWPDTYVEEGNLTRNISTLRGVLGEGANGQQYIETIPRRGYRFVASVQEAVDDGAELIVQERTRVSVTVEEELKANGQMKKPGGGKSRLWGLVAGVAFLEVVIGGIYLRMSSEPGQAEAGTVIQSIAVLPFKPLSEDASDDYFELAMTDTLITKLSDIRQIAVRPTSAIRRYTGLEHDPLAVGREQRVDAVLEGSLQKSGEKIRVTLRLISARDGSSLWAYQCDQQCTDIFAVQDYVSEQVVRALQLQLTGEERKLLAKRYTDHPEAHQLYLKGRYFWSKSTEEGLRKSIEYFNQAIEKDPDYALAYAGLADSYSVLGSYSVLPMEESHPKARALAMKALEIDDHLGEAHTSLAAIFLDFYWDWPEAERQFNRAIELNPNHAITHHFYSHYLAARGRFDEATWEARRAIELDPVSLSSNANLGFIFYLARHYDQAIEQSQKALELDPNFYVPHINIGLAYLQKQKYEAAISEFQEVRASWGDNPYSLGFLGHAYAAAGKKGEAQHALRELSRVSKQRRVSPFAMAAIYAGMGEKERAFEWLENAYQERCWEMGFLKVHPHFDPLRSDPRFADLIRRIGLAP